MSNVFANVFVQNMNTARTENGAVANATTLSYVLDLFSQIGAFRNGTGASARLDQFNRAWAEDKELTLRVLFHCRDIRGGSGERETFRVFLKHLVNTGYESIVKKNLSLIPEYGRWDDLWMFLDVPSMKSSVIDLIRLQLKNDACSKNPSLLAKWLPSENTSSKDSIRLARLIRTGLNLSSRDYRKILSGLRTTINIVEKQMSKKQWDTIQYERVPSRAAILYKDAFKSHDETRYNAYIQAVLSGEKKINSSALFPYEILKKYIGDFSYAGGLSLDPTLEALWKNLPNYIAESDNSLVVADTSGSMSGIPIHVAISLAIYIAERNKGCWHNKFINFSTHPSLQILKGETLLDKIKTLCTSEWYGSTDVKAVFMAILETAKRNKLPKEDMVKRVFIISDMEFNQGAPGMNVTLFREISSIYNNAGYELPELVFWNVRSAREQFPMSLQDTNFNNVSGSSPSILQYMFTGVKMTAYERMLSVINSERYQAIKV